MRRALPLLIIALAGCAGGADRWSKPGIDPAATSREYQECRELTDIAVGPQADIDQDIAATRGADAQRSTVVRLQNQTAHESTRDRAGRLMAACMNGKGFAPAK